jgi:hypothetical protein
MMRKGRHRDRILAGVLAGAALLLGARPSGSSSGRDGPGGDPGNHRLNQLADDTIFKQLPDRAEEAKVTLTPAGYRPTELFSHGGWDGPGVKLTFTSSASPRSVYEFFDRQARAAGWGFLADGSLHIPAAWSRTYANGAYAMVCV